MTATPLRTLVTLAFVLATAGCASVREPRCKPGEELSVSELLYFGTAKPTGTVTSEEWAEFLSLSVTPRFPQGPTAWRASGQWKGADGAIVREASFVLNLLHVDDERTESAVRAIAAEYKSRFNQEAVLRVKSQACTSF
jgi:hypothetical protein